VPLFIERTKPVPPIAQIQSNRYPTALVLFSHKAKSLSERSRVQRPSPSHLIWLGRAGKPIQSGEDGRLAAFMLAFGCVHDAMLFVNMVSRLIALSLTVALGGCATADFTPDVGGPSDSSWQG
jgi:hypothetical protein